MTSAKPFRHSAKEELASTRLAHSAAIVHLAKSGTKKQMNAVKRMNVNKRASATMANVSTPITATTVSAIKDSFQARIANTA